MGAPARKIKARQPGARRRTAEGRRPSVRRRPIKRAPARRKHAVEIGRSGRNRRNLFPETQAIAFNRTIIRSLHVSTSACE